MNKLSMIRKKKGYSQAKLAEISEVNLGTIQKYESSERDISKAQVQTVKKLADALDITINELIGEISE